MSRREFTFYVVSKDKQSEDLIIYFYENMKDIKRRGFPKPMIYKLTRKQILKSKDNLMDVGIRVLPSIKFNGNVYSRDELYSLLKTDLHKLKKKNNKKEDEDPSYYDNVSDDYFAMMGMSVKSGKGNSKSDVHTSYHSEEEPLTESGLKEIIAKQEAGRRRPESQQEVRGTTIKDDSDIDEISEEEVVKSKKSSSKKSKQVEENEDYDSIDAYYADLAMKGDSYVDDD